MNVVSVTSLENEELRPYATLRRPRDHFDDGVFVAEGEKVFDRMLLSDILVLSALMTPAWFEEKRSALERSAPTARIYLAPHALLEGIVGFHLHQGIMGLGRVPSPPSLNEVLQLSAPPRLVLALDGLANAENVGVIVRNASAFGVSAILVGETSSSPYLRRSVRNSMGAVFSLPVIHTPDLVLTLHTLRSQHAVSTLALEVTSGSRPLHTQDLTRDVCLVVGSEADGLRPGVMAACDERVVIPMQPGVDSLNVANAAAVALYEVHRQRNERLRPSTAS